MIVEILGRMFPIEHGLSPDDILVPVTRYSTPFTLSDPKACNPCQANPNRADRVGCSREILRVNNNGTEIAVVNYEQYITQFDRTPVNVGERCDLLMTDSGNARQKIVFCDLCCYEEKYVEPNDGNRFPEGKRAKARRQMERTLDLLVCEPTTTAVNILTYHEKVCLFAWRDYDVPDSPVTPRRGDARANVQVFSSTVSNLAATTTSHHQKMGHDFTFMQVKYPTEYNW